MWKIRKKNEKVLGFNIEPLIKEALSKLDETDKKILNIFLEDIKELNVVYVFNSKFLELIEESIEKTTNLGYTTLHTLFSLALRYKFEKIKEVDYEIDGVEDRINRIIDFLYSSLKVMGEDTGISSVIYDKNVRDAIKQDDLYQVIFFIKILNIEIN